MPGGMLEEISAETVTLTKFDKNRRNGVPGLDDEGKTLFEVLPEEVEFSLVAALQNTYFHTTTWH